MIKHAYSVSFVSSINIFVWQNVLYFLDVPRKTKYEEVDLDRYGLKQILNISVTFGYLVHEKGENALKITTKLVFLFGE